MYILNTENIDGKKNYSTQYYRVLKNILLSQAYDIASKKKLYFQKKF